MNEKTEQEILEADKQEFKIEQKKIAGRQAARREFNKATKEEWEEYQKVWKPARERWEKFSELFFEVMQTKLVANRKAYDEALAKVRGNWKVCPKCGASAARYQTYCTDEKCGTNLLTGALGGGDER